MCACQQITRLHVWFLHTLHIYINYMHCIALHCIALQYIAFIHTHQSHTSHTSQTLNINTNTFTFIPKSNHITSNDITLHCIRYTFCKNTNTVPPNFDNDDPLHTKITCQKFPKNSNCTHDWLRSLGLAVFSSIFKDGTFAAASAAAPTIGGRGLSCEFQKNPTFMPRFFHKKPRAPLNRSYEAHYGVP